MYAIIAGSGRLGAGLAHALCSDGHDVAVIDSPLDRRRLDSSFDGLAIEGNPVDSEILELAGIRKAELFVAATADDNVNAAALQAAKGIYGVAVAVAQIADPEKESFYRQLGFDTICPTTTGINQILDFIRDKTFSPLRAVVDPSMVCVVPREDWIGRRPVEIAMPAGKRIVGLVRAGKAMTPAEARELREDDSIILASRRKG
jgi:trk system potassium uptake protein TrkA